MINIARFETGDSFTRLQQEWNALLKQSPVDDAFLTWEWLSTWWKHYGHFYRLCLLTAREGNQLVGIAPLMLEQQKALGLKIRVLRNIGVPPPDVGGLIIQNGREDVLAKFAGWLVENQKTWDVLNICEIPPGGMNMGLCETQFPRDGFVSQVDLPRHFYIPMEGDWESYYRKLSRNLRKDLKKKIGHLEEGEGYRFVRKIGREATSADMETVFMIDQNVREVHNYGDEAKRDFHRELGSLMAEQGWLDVSFLYLGDTPVAFRYGFCYNGCFEDWRTGFDAAYFPLSVGKILLFFLIQDGFERGLKSLHFLRGDEDYKLDWNVETRLFSYLQIVRKTPTPMLTHVYFQGLKRKARSFLSGRQSLHPLIAWYDKKISRK